MKARRHQNLRRDDGEAIRRLHDLGVLINGSFVFGMDADDGSVFERTVEWAIEQGIETATFHVLTPYRVLRCMDGWRRSAGSRFRIGLRTPRATRCSVQQSCRRTSSSRRCGESVVLAAAGRCW